MVDVMYDVPETCFFCGKEITWTRLEELCPNCGGEGCDNCWGNGTISNEDDLPLCPECFAEQEYDDPEWGCEDEEN